MMIAWKRSARGSGQDLLGTVSLGMKPRTKCTGHGCC